MQWLNSGDESSWFTPKHFCTLLYYVVYSGIMRRIEMKREEWIPGVPDSLTVPCGICGHVPRFDYNVRNEAWRMLAPEEHRLGVICLPCLNKIAKEKSIKLADYLTEVFFCDGLGETIDLAPVVAYFYEPKER